jgi:murein DD-endopeptidase MepM/ murein hydrolase activator NlpD
MRYTVKPGDSLSTIARAHGLSLAKLLAANPQRRANPDAIRVGDEVEIDSNSARCHARFGTGHSAPLASGCGDEELLIPRLDIRI